VAGESACADLFSETNALPVHSLPGIPTPSLRGLGLGPSSVVACRQELVRADAWDNRLRVEVARRGRAAASLLSHS